MFWIRIAILRHLNTNLNKKQPFLTYFWRFSGRPLPRKLEISIKSSSQLGLDWNRCLYPCYHGQGIRKKGSNTEKSIRKSCIASMTVAAITHVRSVDGHFFKLRWIWSCSTSFCLDLCPLTIFDQYDFILSLYCSWPLWRKFGQPLLDITQILIKSLFFIIWHPTCGLAIGFQGQLIHLWHQINSEMSPKEWYN